MKYKSQKELNKKEPAQKEKLLKSGDTKKESSKKEAVNLTPPKKIGQVHQILPLIFGLFAFLFFVTLFLNLLCNWENRLTSPADHWMGVVGYYTNEVLLGLFGLSAFLIPVILLNFALNWKKFVEKKSLWLETLYSVLFLFFFSATVHIFALIGYSDHLVQLSIPELYFKGASFQGGGVVGGEVGYFLHKVMNFAGSLIFTISALVILAFLILRLSPKYLWERFRLRRELRAETIPSISEQEAEQAEYRVKMNEKLDKLSSKKKEESNNQPPEDAITKAPQKNEKENMAPMPIPKLHFGGESSKPFVPDDLKEETKVADDSTKAPVAPDPAAGNKESDVDLFFPKEVASKIGKKSAQKEDSFDLTDCFGTDSKMPRRAHATLPPEVPMEGGNIDVAELTDIDEFLDAEKARAVQDEVPTEKPVFRHADAEPMEFGIKDELSAASSDAPKEEKPYAFPPVSYLRMGEPMSEDNVAEIEESMNELAETFRNFRVGVKEINYSCGPTVTRYEVTPAPGVRVRTIVGLADDIACSLASAGVRMEAPIPGKNAVGVEVPNRHRSPVVLRDLIETKEFSEAKSKLTACLGVGIAGTPIFFDIATMPHLLVAGTTGSGKSVCINCIILSLLYKARPDEVKLVLIDPKKVEFTIYRNIPHLLAPIVTTPKDAAGALQAAVEEMERRFELFSEVEVHDLKNYNAVTKDDPDKPFLPQIVIIIDELADLMMTAPDEVETAICRIAQKARAAGMHLIVGTQRPSVDVVTGLIKSNVPSRIAFTVSSQVDSRTIIDTVGAEKLTGKGDMLFAPIGVLKPARIQGAFVDDKEVERICEFIRNTNGVAQYDENFIAKLKELAAQCGVKKGGSSEMASMSGEGGDKNGDAKYSDAVRIAVEEKKISTSLLQRKLGIGYGRAAKIIDRMQSEGIVSAPDGGKPRTTLITPEEYLDRFVNCIDEDPPEE